MGRPVKVMCKGPTCKPSTFDPEDGAKPYDEVVHFATLEKGKPLPEGWAFVDNRLYCPRCISKLYSRRREYGYRSRFRSPKK
jgi:hypothetical protein